MKTGIFNNMSKDARKELWKQTEENAGAGWAARGFSSARTPKKDPDDGDPQELNFND